MIVIGDMIIVIVPNNNEMLVQTHIRPDSVCSIRDLSLLFQSSLIHRSRTEFLFRIQSDCLN